MTDDPEDLVEIDAVNEPTAAEIMKLALEAEGIPCTIGNLHQAGLTGILAVPVYVRREDVARAQEILRAAEDAGTRSSSEELESDDTAPDMNMPKY